MEMRCTPTQGGEGVGTLEKRWRDTRGYLGISARCARVIGGKEKGP